MVRNLSWSAFTLAYECVYGTTPHKVKDLTIDSAKGLERGEGGGRDIEFVKLAAEGRNLISAV